MIVINDNVDIGIDTILHETIHSVTIIGEGVKIGSYCDIGHNNIIGMHTVIETGVVTGYSVSIRTNCWIGPRCLIKNGVTIGSDVMLEEGSVVRENIIISGIYGGNPAKLIKAQKKE